MAFLGCFKMIYLHRTCLAYFQQCRWTLQFWRQHILWTAGSPHPPTHSSSNRFWRALQISDHYWGKIGLKPLKNTWLRGVASGLSLKIENYDAVRRTSLSLFVGIGGVVRTTLHRHPVQSALRVDTRCRTRGLSQLLWSCQKGSSCLLTTVIYYRPVWLRVNTECVPENRIYPIILLYLSVALGLSKRAGFLCHPIVFTLKILQNISWLIHTKTMSWSLKSREVSVSISDHLRYVTYPRCLQL